VPRTTVPLTLAGKRLTGRSKDGEQFTDAFLFLDLSLLENSSLGASRFGPPNEEGQSVRDAAPAGPIDQRPLGWRHLFHLMTEGR
jgi:hypothetical protein